MLRLLARAKSASAVFNSRSVAWNESVLPLTCSSIAAPLDGLTAGAAGAGAPACATSLARTRRLSGAATGTIRRAGGAAGAAGAGAGVGAAAGPVSCLLTLDSGLGTWDLGLGTWDSGLWTLDSGLWTLDFGLWTSVFGLWTLDFGLWTLDFGAGSSGGAVAASVSAGDGAEGSSSSGGTSLKIGPFGFEAARSMTGWPSTRPSWALRLDDSGMAAWARHPP